MGRRFAATAPMTTGVGKAIQFILVLRKSAWDFCKLPLMLTRETERCEPLHTKNAPRCPWR